MIESTINREKAFQLRINFNLKSLKKVGIEKSQIWLTTTINGERVRIYTKLLIKEEHWFKKVKVKSENVPKKMLLLEISY